ncbi:TadE/TadG family type IV pilus assembly protein [Pacificibacter marinus]|uniref:TadE/TadG family type IV pilus assembly protein n=1 Tax=Pacificibacter marinus TaxID=658057 RepID=UPI001C06B446|nr:TadE family protein [Pacificibacter marinus]MBU2867063.1 pilus assembly protein [Pacificibacter marinus]
MKHFRIPKQRIVSIARRYRCSDLGSMSIETVLVLPVILTGLLLAYTYFSAFQIKGMANKAAYTVSDYVSRQTDPIDADFVEGLSSIYGYLTNTGTKSLRLSSFTWSDIDGSPDYKLEWSYAANGGEALNGESYSSVVSRLPAMTSGETVLVMETTTDWAPVFNVGLDDLTFTDFVVTKPRFATQVLFDDGSEDDDGGGDSSDDISGTDTYSYYNSGS